MAASHGQLDCKIYPSAFSGEVVFQVDTKEGDYEGIAPKHYANIEPEVDGTEGKVNIRIIYIGDKKARIRVPDEQILTVSVDKVHEV